ncbi:PAAR-like protein [uncultured Chryseobacterium sp.]|uniref:PAAR-like protein n=1 Tax=uncultured Chryseobacterium sp. TaxID=259322 RepID=UPI0025D8FE84|nr:PAAR-like protein [uncultured Chryseobacterium sp.]
MSKAYIPQDTWAVCTFQQSTGPQKLIATKYERKQFTVLYKGNENFIFLTVGDRNIKEKFICKKPMNMLMAIGGLVVGLILASNPIGWVVAGVCAAVLVASATIAIVTHDCTGPLKAGKWINEKSSVIFDTQKAITETSMLTCDSGGVLQPIISYDVAVQTAKAIAYENIKETAVTTAAAIATGFFMGKGGGFLKAMKVAFKGSGALFTIGGMGATYAMTTIQSNVMRGSSEYADNEIYQRMNKAEEKDLSDPATVGKETVETTKNTALSGAPPSIKDLANVIQLYRTGKIIIEDRALKAQFDQLSKMNKVQLRNSPRARALIKSIQEKRPDVFNEIKRSPNSKPIRLKPQMRDKAIAHLEGEIKKNKWSPSNENSILTKGASLVLFFVPLAGGYFSENARRKLAENAVKDDTSAISVRAES